MKYRNAGRVFKIIFRVAPVSAAVCAFCSLVYALCASLGAGLMAKILTEAETLRQGTLSHVLLLALLYLLIQMTRHVFNIVQDICWNVGVEEKCRFRFQTLLSEKAAALPYIDFEDGRRHDCILRAKECVDAMAVTQSFTNLLATVESVITVIGLLSAMMVYSVWYLPVMLLSVALYLISRLAAGREFYRLRWFQAPHIRKRNYFYSLFTSPAFQKEQRIFGFGDSFRIRWERERDLTVRETVSFKSKDSGRLALCEALITAGYVGGILLSLLLVKNGAIAIGVFGAGIYAFRTAQNSTQAFFSLYGVLGEGLMQAEDFFDFLDLEGEITRDRPISRLKNEIRIRNVRFTYPNTDTPALKIDELTVNAGERVVVVGENGSGKTTLLKLLTGLYTPDSGEILYDGQRLDTLSRESLSELIGAVSQDFVSYHLSVRDNVGIRAPKAAGKDERIREALAGAGLDLPEDMDAWLGREFGGNELSGGQWQRLAVAGTLCKDCQVIFLDEPTSALDPNAEYDILKRFMDISADKTAVIISHRVGLCRLADKVVFMEKGQIRAAGSHPHLINTCPEYRSFYNEQAKWYA